MALSVDDFITRLNDSGLMTSDEVRALVESLPADKRPQDVNQFAQELIRQKKLTAYQAQTVYQGKGQSLILGNYVILDKLGQGGMGMVLKAEHKRMKRLVAIKVMSPAAVKTPDALKRFHREVEAAAKLRHPNIVAADDADEAKGTHFLVMEYVEGSDLSVLVKKNGPLGVAAAVDAILQAAKGLEFAHKRGVTHRDIKPANLLLSTDGTVKILDMGLARIDDSVGGSSESAGLTSTGTIMGTVDYMSPEQAMDTKHADARSDIYSLGCTLYYLLTGKCLYDADTIMKKLMAHQHAPIPRTTEIRGDVPASVDAVFQKMVAKKPEERFQKMADVIVALEACATGNGSASGVNVSIPISNSPSSFSVPPSASSATSVAPVQSNPVTANRMPSDAAESPTMISGEMALTKDLKAATSLSTTGVRDSSSPHSADATSSRPSPWWKDIRVAIGGGVVAVAILAGIFLLPPTAKEVAPPAAPTKTETASTTTGDATPLGWHGWPANAPKPAIAPFDAAQAKRHQEEWAAFLKLPVEYTNSIGMKFVLIPPGEFTMGSTPAEIEDAVKQLDPIDIGWQVCFQSEAPQHKVILTQPIYLGVHEVTQKEYAAVMKSNPAHFAQTGPGKDAVANIDTQNHPVEMVSWNDAVEFCAKLSQQEELKPYYFRAGETITQLDGAGYRLPTEAEWEFACRAGTTTRFWTGDTDEGLIRAGWSGANAGKRTHAVGELKANPLGLFDIHGNVMEWVGDWWEPTYYEQFADKPAIDPQGPPSAAAPDSPRVLRGGYWTVHASHSASSRRDRHHSPFLGRQFGFRVSLPVDAVRQAAGSVGKGPVANGAVNDPPQYALDFNYKLEVGNAHVELLPILRPFEACTVEMYVTTRSVLDKWENRLLFYSGFGMQLLQQKDYWSWSRTHPSKDGTYDRVRVEGSVFARRRMHLAGISTGKELRLFIDGHLAGNTPLVGDLPVVAGVCLLGGPNVISDAFPPFDGLIDEVRISKGVRYNENFTPAPRFETDADTLAVYHFDEGQGDILKDSSGNDHHGKIVGAKWVKADGSPIKPTAPADYALAFNGTESSVEIPSLTYDGTHPLTMEARVRMEGSSPPDDRILAGWNGLLSLSAYQSSAFSAHVFDSAKQYSTLAFHINPAGRDRFHQVAVVYDMQEVRLFVDGVAGQKNPISKLRNLFLELGIHTDHFAIGCSVAISTGRNRQQGDFFRGVIDELRVSKIARYDQDYVHQPRLDADADTLALYHFDEGTGGVLRDSSGHNHHGKIVGAKWLKFDGSPIPSVPVIGPAPPPAKAPFDSKQARAHQEAWAKHLELPVEYTNSIGMKFVLIPPGEFMMGSAPGEIEVALKIMGEDKFMQECCKSEAPQHQVTLTQPIYLGLHEVTQAEHEKVMGKNPSFFAKTGSEKQWVEIVTGLDTANHPVDGVSWNDAAEFCAKLSEQEKLKPFYFRSGETVTMLEGTGYRLPTEAQWEFACRAGATTRYWIGDKDEDLPPAAWIGMNSRSRTHNVGELKANPFGLYDIHGNVSEWVQDSWELTYYGQFLTTGVIDPNGPSSASIWRGLRGGAWGNLESLCRASFRNKSGANYRSPNQGFRVLIAVDTVKESLKRNKKPAAAPPPAKAPFDAKQARAHQEAWAKHLGTTVETTSSVGAKLILIPPGEFLMGSTDEQIAAALKAADEINANQQTKDRIQKAESPQHVVIITKPFLMSATEVSISQFRKFVETTKYVTEAERYGFGDSASHVQDDKVTDEQKQRNWRRPGSAVADDSPVAQISWNDAVEYCKWLSEQEKRTYRLPTEAEWEYACRAGTTTQYSFGDNYAELAKYGWHDKNAAGKSHPVGTLLPNPFGLFDMHGNVQEWCGDYFDEKWYEKKSANDPLGPTAGFNRVLHGGFWSNNATHCRSAYRVSSEPSARFYNIGFRCVSVIDVSATADSTKSVTTRPTPPVVDPPKPSPVDPRPKPFRKPE